MITIADITQADVEAVEGLTTGSGAWDMQNPKDIIAAACNVMVAKIQSKSISLGIIAEVQRLDLRPGDTLVIRSNLNNFQKERALKQFKEVGFRRRIVMMPLESQLAVISETDE